MKIIEITCLALFAISACAAQQQPAAGGSETAPAAAGEFAANLPVQKIGIDDLIGVSVYDSPELTRTVRVSSNGDIRLPMVTQPIPAVGLFPEGLEKAIAAALVRDHLLVDPVVSVSIVEYQSRPIMVIGAVKSSVTFQAAGNVTLLDAISRAGGIDQNAGSEILVTHQPVSANNNSVAITERIPVQSLSDPNSTAGYLKLQAGDIVRVPIAGQIYMVGNVNRPGPFFMSDGSDSTILKAMAITGGLAPYASHTAYIYRRENGQKDRVEIPIELNKIMKRKSPDVQLLAGDILYVPDATGRRVSAKALETSLGLGLGLTGLAIELTR